MGLRYPEVEYFVAECVHGGSLSGVGCGAGQRVFDPAVVTPAHGHSCHAAVRSGSDDCVDAVREFLVASEAIEFDGVAAGREILVLLHGSVV